DGVRRIPRSNRAVQLAAHAGPGCSFCAARIRLHDAARADGAAAGEGKAQGQYRDGRVHRAAAAAAATTAAAAGAAEEAAAKDRRKDQAAAAAAAGTAAARGHGAGDADVDASAATGTARATR